MTKLSDTQSIILSAAAQRADGNVLPLPGSLRGGAATKVVGALLARGLIREHVVDSPRKADAALNTVWRNLEPTAAACCSSSPPPAPTPSASSPRRCPTPSTRAPTPPASRPRARPRAPTRRRSRRPRSAGPAAEGGAHGRERRACAQDPRRHQAGAADRDAPPQGGRHHRADRRGHRLAAAHRARRLRRGAEEEARPDRHLGEGRGRERVYRIA